MRISQIISIVVLVVFTYAQESAPTHSGAEYFRFQPGAKWEMHMVGGDGKVMSRTYYEISSKATESKVSIQSQSVFAGFWSPKSVNIYAITMSGEVVQMVWLVEPSTYETFTPPQTFLPASLDIGARWAYAVGGGDSAHCEVVEYLPGASLPNGQVYSDLVVIKKREGGGNAYYTTYIYRAPKVGLIGIKESREKGWFEYLEP